MALELPVVGGRRKSYQAIGLEEDNAARSDENAAETRKKNWLVLVVGSSSLFAFCLTLALAWPSSSVPCSLTVYQTSKNGASSLLHGGNVGACRFFTPGRVASEGIAWGVATATVTADRRQRKQAIIGFGGAFTEAAALNFAMLPAAAQQKVGRWLINSYSDSYIRPLILRLNQVLDLYWGPAGIGYTVGRYEFKFSFEKILLEITLC
jgi:hypothetical protein